MTFEDWAQEAFVKWWVVNHKDVGSYDPRCTFANETWLAAWDAAEQACQKRVSLAQAEVTRVKAQLDKAIKDSEMDHKFFCAMTEISAAMVR